MKMFSGLPELVYPLVHTLVTQWNQQNRYPTKVPNPMLLPAGKSSPSALFQEVTKKRYFILLDCKMNSNCTLIKVFDNAESKKHNEKFVRQLKYAVPENGARPKKGAQLKH